MQLIVGLKIIDLIRLIRYRFFLFAGMLPYLLGQAVAFDLYRSFHWRYFWLGFAGIFFVLVAVELFNEYFDDRQGGDRIFSPEKAPVPEIFWLLGILMAGAALVIGLCLALQRGWPVLLFASLGFIGAYFYVGPPLRWAYRGFGEMVIGLCYGPLMVLGSCYLQTASIDFVPFFVSLICGLSVFCLAVLNEIPDYYQDMLIGKRNLVVRLGKQKAILLLKFCLVVLFALLVFGIAAKKIPLFTIAAGVTIPWLLKSIRVIDENYDNPKGFHFAVNTFVCSHILLFLSLGIGFLKDGVK